jgi:hypothetical protein
MFRILCNTVVSKADMYMTCQRGCTEIRMISYCFLIAGIMVQTVHRARGMCGSRRNYKPWKKLIENASKENSKTGIRI